MLLMGTPTARHPDLFLFIIGMALVLWFFANYSNWLKAFDAWLYKRLDGL